jgi:hypothetical protein
MPFLNVEVDEEKRDASWNRLAIRVHVEVVLSRRYGRREKGFKNMPSRQYL